MHDRGDVQLVSEEAYMQQVMVIITVHKPVPLLHLLVQIIHQEPVEGRTEHSRDLIRAQNSFIKVISLKISHQIIYLLFIRKVIVKVLICLLCKPIVFDIVLCVLELKLILNVLLGLVDIIEFLILVLLINLVASLNHVILHSVPQSLTVRLNVLVVRLTIND